MVARLMESKLRLMISKFPFVAVLGPRQSGKSTLVRRLLPEYSYVNLERLDMREFATQDPLGFLKQYPGKVIFDEIQNVPNLFSWLQVHADERGTKGDFILTGSQHFLLMEQISQSLAGRIALLYLLPFSFEELKLAELAPTEWESYAYMGSYPRIYDAEIEPNDFYPNYETTYIERDVRTLLNVGNLSQFRKLLKLLAGRIGKELNLSSLASDIGVSYKTIQDWISVLEASFIVFRLNPYFKNFNKRVIKSPKIYFYDTGLACHLLEIQTVEQLKTHYNKGELFENLILLEIKKYFLNQGINKAMYFWKDSNHNEVDLLFESGNELIAIEMKSAKTIHSDFFKTLNYMSEFAPISKKVLIYGGEEKYERSGIFITNLFDISFLSGL